MMMVLLLYVISVPYACGAVPVLQLLLFLYSMGVQLKGVGYDLVVDVHMYNKLCMLIIKCD